METKYGFPVVTANDYLAVIAQLGIKPWERAREPEPLEQYLARPDLTDGQRNEAQRFAPKSEVVQLIQPNGQPYTGFRSVGKDWAGLFVLLPGDLLPIVAEWKHGSESLSLTPPCGVVTAKDRSDSNPMAACARREFEEETGIFIPGTWSLSVSGIPISSRQSTQRFFPYLGVLNGEPVIGPSKLDQTEHLKVILFPLMEWMRLLTGGVIFDDCAASLTFLALKRLGRLRLT